MKTIILILLTSAAFGQGVYVGVGVTYQSALYQAGYVNKVTIEVSYKNPFTSTEKAKTAALQIGYRLEFAKHLSITPSAGIANRRYQNFKAYDSDRTGRTAITNVNEYLPIASVSLDYAIFFATVNYCGGVYAGGGIRVYFSKL